MKNCFKMIPALLAPLAIWLAPAGSPDDDPFFGDECIGGMNCAGFPNPNVPDEDPFICDDMDEYIPGGPCDPF